MSKIATKYSPKSEFQDRRPNAKMRHWNYPQEINRGTIDASRNYGCLFYVQANTAKGRWNLYPIPNPQVDEDEFGEFLEDPQQSHQIVLRWSRRSPSVTWTQVPLVSADVEPSATIEERAADDEEMLDDWQSSASELLVKLQDSSISRNELFDTVLFAEIATFDKPQTELLVARLFAFVSEYRLLQDDEVKTAVGAAIRKLAMNLHDEQIEQYADLFLPTDTRTLPCEIELELAKAILWRLTTASASPSREFPKLESRLAELASDYLKPRLILQENYASVAMQAALGVLLLNAQHADSVLKSIEELGIDWFADLFQRRLGRLRKQLAKKGDAAAATNLGRFESELQSASD